MIKQCSLFFASGILISTQTSVFAATDSFLEQNGRLIVEAESGAYEGDWSFEDSIFGSTGTGYLVWKGVNNYAKAQAVRGDAISYHFSITTPGNYELRWRSRNTEGLDATEHNDSWVRFPTGTNIDGQHPLNGWTKAYMGQVAQWTWDVYTVDSDNQLIRQYFDAGDHVIEIAGRSNGHGIDRFALYRYEDSDFNVAEFEALPQSPRASQSQQPAHPHTGNSCVGDTLSLAANATLGYNASGIREYNNDILSITGPNDFSLIEFTIPGDLISTNSSLKLASSDLQTLQLSAYLASHSRWNASTPIDELPYPSTLLGTLSTASIENSIGQLRIDSSMLGTGPVTMMLNTESGLTQQVAGIGTQMEPRLELLVAEDFCAQYNLGRISTNASDNDDESQDTEENTGSTNDGTSGTEDTGNTDEQDATNTDSDSENNEESSPDTGNVSDTNNPEETMGGNIDPYADLIPVETEIEEETTDAQPARNRKRGGSLSIWALFVLASVASVFRKRRHAV